MSTPRFRCYRTSDVEGVELGGALKNVLAIACGISDGLGFGSNGRAALITRGLDEITRLAGALRCAAGLRHLQQRVCVPWPGATPFICAAPLPPPTPAVGLGANPLTLAGLSGIGDIVLTCTGDLSRNRTVRPRLHAACMPPYGRLGAYSLLGAGLGCRPALAPQQTIPHRVAPRRALPHARWACAWARARSWPTSRPP